MDPMTMVNEDGTVGQQPMGLIERIKTAGQVLLKGQVQRDKPEPEPARRALCKHWQSVIKEARQYWRPVFEQMRADMRFVAGKQWPNQTKDDKRYVANIVQRQVGQKVGTLYARNPKAVARRRPALEYQVWDGTQEQLQEAQQRLAASMAQMETAMGGNGETAMPGGLGQPALPPDPEALAIVQDWERGMQHRRLLDRVARTLELLYAHQFDMQEPRTKRMMKKLVRRVSVTGVGYLKLGYLRDGEITPSASASISGLTQRLQAIQQRAFDLADDETSEDEKGAEELAQMVTQLAADVSSGEAHVSHEGLVFDFPKSTSIIVDPACTSLDGFVGADWIAEEFLLSPQQVQEIYHVDVKTGEAMAYTKRGDAFTESSGNGETGKRGDGETPRVCVWELYHKETQLKYVLCDGYADFLEEPETPAPQLERFWPVFTLMFRENEIEENAPEELVSIYPQSDVSLLRPMQMELNRSRDSLRDHRIANRAKYGVAAGRLSDADKEKLVNHPPNAVIEIQGLAPGEKVSDLIQPIQTVPIDPRLYDTSHVERDSLMVVGSQEANFGPLAGATATEASIAESSRLTATGSDVDELDSFLSDVAEAGGQMLLMEMPAQRVKEIAGQGAAWPTLNRDQIRRKLYLEVEAASSGKPDQELEGRKFERIAPVLMQLPGISPEFLAREAIRRLDDRLELEDAFTPGQQSIQSLNRGQAGQFGPNGAAAGPANGPTGPAAVTPPAGAVEVSPSQIRQAAVQQLPQQPGN